MKVQRLCQYEEGQFKVIDVFRYKTLYERKEEILTEKEKEYLAGVIKPFREKIQGILKKIDYNDFNHYIQINCKKEEDLIMFPTFKKDTMYKNMEVGKEYTLEELGL